MLRPVILFASMLLTALSAGLLFAYACSVNPGLHRLPDPAYLAAMQHINRAIQNPVFFISFMGPVILLPWSAWLEYRSSKTAFRYLLGAALLYVFGVFGVTILGNVPLNEALESFDLVGVSPERMTAQRSAFEVPWGSWHLVRTVAAVISAGLALAAAFSNKAGN